MLIHSVLIFFSTMKKNFKGVIIVMNRDLAELKAEYRSILERLDKLEQEGIIGAFDKRTIIELSGDVMRNRTEV